MKIISKHKDYYDYMVGIYGLDPTITYDRRTDNLIRYEQAGYNTFGNPVSEHVFHICNNKVIIFEYKNKLYHQPNELIDLNKKLLKDGNGQYRLWAGSSWYKIFMNKEETGKNIYDYYNKRSDINIKYRVPVLLECNNDYCLPYLETFEFYKVYDPDTIYQMIYAFQSWLIDNPPIPNKQTDMEKLQSHGFDKKISFRHRK